MTYSRQIFIIATYCIILLLLTEVLLRLALTFYEFDFFRPSESIYNKFYASLKPFIHTDIKSDDQVKDILILGGSVVSPAWSRLETRLDSILTDSYPGHYNVSVYNAAMPAHTSLDNLYKYQLLEKQRFDLVIFYEAINETRANNIAIQDFKSDYSHIKWYEEIRLLRAHPEINWSVIPYLVDKGLHELGDLISGKAYINYQDVDTRYKDFGSDIKTAASYRDNVAGIINLASRRGDKLLLLSYAHFFPPGAKLTGDSTDRANFAKCRFATPVTVWGDPDHVHKGIDTHNSELVNLSRRNSVLFMDMENAFPQDPALFCDVCHLSEAGAQRFAKELANYIISKKILD